MFDDQHSFITRSFLQSNLHYEFQAYLDEGRDAGVLAKLQSWHSRAKLTETQAESAFIQSFFVEMWGYGQSGHGKTDDHTILPKFAIAGAGAKGGSGEADLALGWFRGGTDAVPQVLCEFKDISSELDTKQNRKGSNLTPVEQCLNYVRGARKTQFGNEPVQAWWGLATDMNEFRLYWWDRAPGQCLKFTISGKKDLFFTYDLLSDGDDARFDRFLFQKLFQRDMLISHSGRPTLWRMVEKQGHREEKIEEEFYTHYRTVRERLFNLIVTHNPHLSDRKSDLLRVSQKLLDRFIFAFYCEDMGQRMLFPPQFIRDEISRRSMSEYYEAEGTDIWDFFRRLFTFMNDGGVFGQTKVPHINGGLFADDALINSLVVPNMIFATQGQGLNSASYSKDKATLLFLSANYNYAAKGDAKESLTLYTLGRIFEQSITELEYRIGELENRDTVAKLSKRKRDGVYYTPEWVVNYLVDETMGPWFAEAQAASGMSDGEAVPQQLQAYLKKLRNLRVVDPACGSGAFLISAFRKLLAERQRLAKQMQVLGLKDESGFGFDEAKLISDILQNNIYGVDINPSSVEIAKLALWLHSARANSPLSSLDHTIRCGNSLVAPDCWAMIARNDVNEARVNPFDWHVAFPFKFDIVLGNPPYVKLQNLMKADPDVVAYITAQREVGTYESAMTGNFDLYLPFIEKGLRLLSEGGRMAYIAPSLWTVNEYGAGLRGLMHRTKQLERWIDFKSFQVFKEAITYTALQFFTCGANDVVKIAASPDGEVGDVYWGDAALDVEADALRADAEWLMLTGEAKALVNKLAINCLTLNERKTTEAIFQGLVTSADSIYHLKRLGKNSYLCELEKNQQLQVTIEDSIMKPLISGPQAKRFESPEEDKYLLFPYFSDEKGEMRLGTSQFIQSKFPNAWLYLKRFESELRSREKPKMDIEDGWWGYVYPKNLASHDRAKLIVAQTVPAMRVSADYDGDKYLNNVRVNGILPAKGTDLSFLLGVLNGPVVDFVFRRIAKPKDGGWFEANKQFIAPLPIPHATPAQQKAIGKMARALQEKWTERRDLLHEAEGRLSVLPRATYKPKFLWPELPELTDLKKQAAKKLMPHEQTEFAHKLLDEEIAKSLEFLRGFLNRRAEMQAVFAKGELMLVTEDTKILSKIYLDDAKQGKLLEKYWNYLILKRPKDATRFAKDLGSFPSGMETPAAKQFMGRVDALLTDTLKLRDLEQEMNEALYELYGLSEDEKLLIEKDCAARALI